MKHVLFGAGFVAIAVGFLFACSSDDSSHVPTTPPPPPPQQSGELDIAEFTYKCVLPSDAQCDFDTDFDAGVGSGSDKSLPQLATGSTFGLNLNYRADAGPGAQPAITALHTDFLTVGGDGTIKPIKAGKSTLGLDRGDHVVDLVDVVAVDATNMLLFSAQPTGDFSSVKLSGGASGGSVSGSVAVKETFTFRFRVVAAVGDVILAGAFPCMWTTTDKDIANIKSDPTDNIVTVVTGSKTGTATLHVTLGTFSADIPVTVGS